MTGRCLIASINETTVGTLEEINGLWRFHYAAAWLGKADCFAL